MISIYTLTDPRTEEVFYVGQSVNPKERYGTHIYTRKKVMPRQVGLTPTQERICEICDSGLKPIMSIIDTADGFTESRQKEDHWIRTFRAEGKTLTNIMNVIGVPVIKHKPTPLEIAVKFISPYEVELLRVMVEAGGVMYITYRNGHYCAKSLEKRGAIKCLGQRYYKITEFGWELCAQFFTL